MSGHSTHFTIYRDERGEWQWTLISANGKKVARSTHGYQAKQDCVRSVRNISLITYNATVFNAEENAYEVG